MKGALADMEARTDALARGSPNFGSQTHGHGSSVGSKRSTRGLEVKRASSRPVSQQSSRPVSQQSSRSLKDRNDNRAYRALTGPYKTVGRPKSVTGSYIRHQPMSTFAGGRVEVHGDRGVARPQEESVPGETFTAMDPRAPIASKLALKRAKAGGSSFLSRANAAVSERGPHGGHPGGEPQLKAKTIQGKPQGPFWSSHFFHGTLDRSQELNLEADRKEFWNTTHSYTGQEVDGVYGGPPIMG